MRYLKKFNENDDWRKSLGPLGSWKFSTERGRDLSKEKKNKRITQNRFVGNIKIDDLINFLEDEKEKAEKAGYSNLNVRIKEETGIIDIYLHGEEDLTDDDIDTRERVAVINRTMDKTSKGLTRDDLLSGEK